MRRGSSGYADARRLAALIMHEDAHARGGRGPQFPDLARVYEGIATEVSGGAGVPGGGMRRRVDWSERERRINQRLANLGVICYPEWLRSAAKARTRQTHGGTTSVVLSRLHTPGFGVYVISSTATAFLCLSFRTR